MSKLSRKEQREAVFALLFETEFHPDMSPEEIFALSGDNREIADDEYVKDTYFGVRAHLQQIDEIVSRHAKGWKTSNGACMEMLAKGVKYKGEKIDVAIRVIVFNDSRDAMVEAECVSGQKVQFMTGVNMHNGQQSTEGSVGKSGYMAAWGIHPADVVENPLPIGGGLVYNKKKWQQMVAKSDLMWIVSKKPTKKATTKIVAACSREKELNEWGKFVEYLKSVKM
jgi:hypothetical protein